nr:amidohydrolase family protein [Gemmatimonadota bacterium]NIT87294.1 amidohydrolase family protein [Gemmatimonadota bacterium]NIU31138.1 amidohydrolase family protein [Gemmatimonadota bacterium]NIU35864.1 amidohydrolase family protein [Gemmatimonadota bacterium]NIV61498.1 amidohydrolase family protein [Gemmatimonadota bacterium]
MPFTLSQGSRSRKDRLGKEEVARWRAAPDQPASPHRTADCNTVLQVEYGRIAAAGTETPSTLPGHTTPERYARTVERLRNAWELDVPITFSTDADYYVPGKTRGEVAIEFIETWKDAGIPPADILRAMTITGYRASETMDTRGPIRPGLAADLIAVRGNPLEDI